MKPKYRSLLLFLATTLVSLVAAQAEPTDKPAEAIVARTPETITVNGDALDWKSLPAQSVRGNQGEIAQFKLAYDAGAFYALVEVKDASPLKNSASAADPALMLKTGDAIGLTFGPSNGQGLEQRFLFALVEGKPTAMVYRPRSAEKKPYTFESPVGKVVHDYVAALPEARVAFKTTPEGYTAEIKIPWTVLGYTGRDGFDFPFDLQVILSDPAGQLNAATAWWHSVGGGALSTVDLPSEAQLYPELWGKAKLYQIAPVVAQKTEEIHRQTGVPIQYTVPKDVKVSLNITDENGWILRELLVAQPHLAGTYTTYWDGRDEYGDPMPPGKYEWKALLFEGIGSKRIGGAGNSARPPFRTPDGLGDLGASHGSPAAIAADTQGVYHLGGTEEGNPGLTKLSPDGFPLWKRSTGSYGTGAAMTANDRFAAMIIRVGGKTVLVTLDPKTGKDLPVGAKGSRFELGDAKLPLKGLAILGDRAYFGLSDENQIAVLNLATGEKETPFAVPSPRDLARLDDSHLLIVSNDQVLKWDVTTGKSTVLVPKLDDPQAIAIDASGQFYVGQTGDTQQITKFSADGKTLLAIGTPGGRPATAIPYDPNGVRSIRSLAIAPDGNVWFLEKSALLRAGVFSPDGKWIKDVFQTPPSQGGAGIDLEDPSRVFYHTDRSSSIVQAKIDFAANALDPLNPASYWKPEAVYQLTESGDYAKPGPDDVAAQSAKGPLYAPISFTGANGKHYFWMEGSTASLWLEEKGRLVPVQVIGTNEEKGTLFPAKKKFSWSDANGDGLPSAEEIDFNDSGKDDWRWIDKDLTLYGAGGTLKPYKIDDRGVPFYHRSDWQPDVTQGRNTDSFYRDGSNGIFPSPPAPDGARYDVFNIGAGKQVSFWDRVALSRIARIKDGKIQWIAGQHDGRKLNPGGAVFLWRPMGEVDGVFVVGDVDFHLLAYTNDGFALGGVNPHYSQGLTPENIVQENVQGGHFIKDPKTGKALMVIGSGSEALVLEVTGLEADRFQRIGGEITLPSAEPASPQTAGQYSILYRTWPQRDNGRYLNVTGDGWGWRPEIPWLEIRENGKVEADVRLRRDAGTLQIFARVLDSTPLPESGTVTFGQSDGVELLIGPADPANRTAPIAGDTRIFLSASHAKGKLKGVLLASRPGNGQPELAPIPGAKIEARESLNGLGYHLEAEIPLSFFPELCQDREVCYLRYGLPGGKREGHLMESRTEVKPDLVGPLRLNAAVWQQEGNTSRRIPWVPDGQTATNPLNPSQWGAVNASVLLEWPYLAGAKFNLFRSTNSRFEDATLFQTVTDTDYASDTPGMGSFTYWVEALVPNKPPQLAGPMHLALEPVAKNEPRLPFTDFAEQVLPALGAIPAQKVFPGSTTVVDLQLAAKKLTATVANPALKVQAVRIDDVRWRLVIQANETLPADFRGPVKLVAELATGKPQSAEFTLETTPVQLAGLLTNTGGQLAIDTAQLAAGKPVATLDWSGVGNLETRSLGSAGYVFFRHASSSSTTPIHELRPPFVDTFNQGDGFWYGEVNSNMRFDLNGTPGTDATGYARFGSVNANAGTPDKGPGVEWKIEATDSKPHRLTIFSPAIKTKGAKERFTLTAADGTTQNVEFDSSQGGAVIQFRFVGNVTLRVQQTVGGMGSSNPGANCAALFFD